MNTAAFYPKDMRTWKFAEHHPDAKRFCSMTVVGPVLVKSVRGHEDRGAAKKIVWGKKFLQFGGLFTAEVHRDSVGEYFRVYQSVADETNQRNGRIIRPNMPPECDADVDNAKVLHDQKMNKQRAAEEAESRAQREREKRRREQSRLDSQKAAASRVAETLHVGDVIAFKHPQLERGFARAQVMSMRDVAERVPWTHKLDWTFDGFYSGYLLADTPVFVYRRRGESESRQSQWLWPLGSYKLPLKYEEPLRESDERRQMRSFFDSGNTAIESAGRKYMSGSMDGDLLDSDDDDEAFVQDAGGGASAAPVSAFEDLYPNLRL